MDWATFFAENPQEKGESPSAWCKRIESKALKINTKFDHHRILQMYVTAHKGKDYSTPTSNKKVGVLNWREVLNPIKQLQEIKKKASSSQDHATWSIKTDKPIAVIFLGDGHLGSWATDYDILVRITDEIKSIPNLYVIILGDMLQMAIKLRGVLEVSDNIVPPKMQLQMLDSWLQEIKHKVIASTWDNHSVMREENATGYSAYADIFSRHTIYHNHIGHLDINVGSQTYKLAVSHKYQHKSELNPCHGPMKYMRFHAPDRDLAAQGDYHVPGVIQYTEGGKDRVALVCGTAQTSSGYAKRFFTLTTFPHFPCVTFDPHEKLITPYKSVKEWLRK